MNLPFGMIALIVVGILIYFGIAQRLLDRMRLTDWQAIGFIIAVIAGSFVTIPVSRPPLEIGINVGGALLPFLLAVYLIIKADETRERVRAVIATLLVAGAISLGSRYLPYEPEDMFMDPKLLYGLAAGLIAYISGRSRRSAFIGAVLGVIVSDVVHIITISRSGVAGTTIMGGAGALDVTIIAGLVAILAAEIIGETREKIQGGPVLGPNRPEGLYEFSNELTDQRKNSKDSDDNINKNEPNKSQDRGDDGE